MNMENIVNYWHFRLASMEKKNSLFNLLSSQQINYRERYERSSEALQNTMRNTTPKNVKRDF